MNTEMNKAHGWINTNKVSDMLHINVSYKLKHQFMEFSAYSIKTVKSYILCKVQIKDILLKVYT